MTVKIPRFLSVSKTLEFTAHADHISSGVIGKCTHSVMATFANDKRVNIWRRENRTRNEWRRCKTTLDTGEEDVKLHSKRV